jgi:CheY-like chemotaxis protein
MQKHGGHISVESEANVGTKFSLYFPACASGVKPIKLGTAPLQHGRGTILVMDDEEPIRLLAEEMLSHCGYQCELAKDGYETIALFQEAIERGTPFSAVILDLTVPGSLGGKDTLLRLREIDPHVIAFVSSGYSNDPIMANCQTYGFNGVITKPYSLIGLSTILHQNLGVISPQSAETSLPDLEPSQRSDSDIH